MDDNISKQAALAGVSLAMALCAVTTRARAAGSSSAVAEALYEEARGLMKQGKLEPKLSKITIEVASDANTPGLSVALDGAERGAAAWGVGGYFGLHAFSKWSERKDGCANGCTPDAKKAGDSASSSALVSDIGFGVGLIAAGVGTCLVLSSKPAHETSSANAHHEARRTFSLLPVANANGGGFRLRGSY